MNTIYDLSLLCSDMPRQILDQTSVLVVLSDGRDNTVRPQDAGPRGT